MRLELGDCVEVMAGMAEGSIAAIVTDPPYGLEFLGAEWDKLTRNIMRPTSAADIARKEKYGTSLVGRLSSLPDLGASGKAAKESQEWHRQWLEQAFRVLRPKGRIKAFGGTRTFHRIGAAMEAVGFVDLHLEAWTYGSGMPKSHSVEKAIQKTDTAAREDFAGWGSSLKPAWEPVLVGRKP